MLTRNIIDLIPQRPPFVMLDALTYSDDHISRSTFFVATDNIFIEDQLLKEPALIENIAQTVAARAGYLATVSGKPVMLGYIGAVKNLEINFLPRAGETLNTEIIIENQVFNVTFIKGKVFCHHELVASCEMKIFINET